jgi:hypothetical protein
MSVLAIDNSSRYSHRKFLVRWLSGRKQRFAKSKTAFTPESSHLIPPLQFQNREAITSNPFSSSVFLRHLISTRRLTFLTYLFAHKRPAAQPGRQLERFGMGLS